MGGFTILILSALLTLGACSGEKRPNKAQDLTVSVPERVQAKADLYLALAGTQFVPGCDGLLWSSLLGASGGYPDIMAAQGATGRWYRSPSHNCYQTGESKSDISGDMLLGLAWWAYEQGHRDVITGVIRYGEKHTWRMGDGDPFRTIMRPTLIQTYYDLARVMGSDLVPPPDLPKEDGEQKLVAQGFEDHLEVLHALLRSVALGGARDKDVKLFKNLAERQPKNALFQAAYHLFTDGDQTESLALLNDDRYFPPDRLPTEADRCESYLYQRDYDAEIADGDWAPCQKGQPPHPGVDLLFALKVASNAFTKR